jgi:hypothetical protein
MERATEQTDRTNGADAEVPRVPSLDAATKLGQSVTSEGERDDPLIDGVRTRPAKTHSFLLLRYGHGCALRRLEGSSTRAGC